MIGGGDQIYNDAVMTQTTLFQDWLNIKNQHHKREAPFSAEMQEELEDFYLDRYSMWFSQGLFGMANSQIPMINIWDDHGKFVPSLQQRLIVYATPESLYACVWQSLADSESCRHH